MDRFAPRRLAPAHAPDQPADPVDQAGRAGEVLSGTAPSSATLAAESVWTTVLTPAGQAALEVAQTYARKAAAPATLRAYKADWTHYAAWCASKNFVPVPADPATIGAYLASLGQTHKPTTIRRRLSAIRQDAPVQRPTVDLTHRDIQCIYRVGCAYTTR